MKDKTVFQYWIRGAERQGRVITFSSCSSLGQNER